MSCQKTTTVTADTTVLLKQYETFPKSQIDTVASILQKFYGVKTVISHKQKLYPEAFINVKSPRYRADSIIKFQQKEISSNIDYVLGLTSQDISVTKKEASGNIKKPEYKYKDWGIMGLAYCPGESCVVSTFRINSKNKAVYFDRLKKVTVHEFGHNLGLPHCPNKKCVMTDAVESVKTIDNAELKLCSDCAGKINFH
ncbi:matrixin family metalloprotease [Flavobacterium sp. CBA20B-1]|uniref:matrixin family metalloprotease n=1 Tax=unclassified Flavobacterium TaxID=196869 RepID=UPI002224417C|nr:MULTISPECIES: matrixin family metalloprotease [unclassified Flavobacterium]WCM41997.1 matrixin family metalloprotease [Flavobacterium sp. CBA20B-1]